MTAIESIVFEVTRPADMQQCTIISGICDSKLLVPLMYVADFMIEEKLTAKNFEIEHLPGWHGKVTSDLKKTLVLNVYGIVFTCRVAKSKSAHIPPQEFRFILIWGKPQLN